NGGHDPRISRLPRRPSFCEWNYDPPITIAGETKWVCLFECPSWYYGSPLVFIPPKYLAMDRRFHIDSSYVPIYGDVDPSENEKQFYRRSHYVIDAIVQAHKNQGGTILLSAHAGSIEAIPPSLRGIFNRRAETQNLMYEASRVNYCNFRLPGKFLNFHRDL
ncbi:unnamed protein product, partial [Rotaria sp. Silwood2]